ncbi:hypothetical protein [uncultured Dysosmobacter sp.]|uniref:hypothetical protein n=1 Tax=uncultured Dysosmobacter sp. TaxID=2591384 RepID=UPI0026195CFF|nr:hypothetical protein [uncultured Dysosmobacter sp.]
MRTRIDWTKVQPYETVIVCYGSQQTADFIRRAVSDGFICENFAASRLSANCFETGVKIYMFRITGRNGILKTSEIRIPDCGVGYETLLVKDELKKNPSQVQAMKVIPKRGRMTLEEAAEPKLCQLLGVHVGERFRIDYPKGITGELYITGGGLIERVDGGKRHDKIGNSIAYAIQHPKKVIKPPRWTEEDIQDAKALRRMWPIGTVEVRRYGDEYYTSVVVYLTCTGDVLESLSLRHCKIFPSLQINECVDIDQILEESHGQQKENKSQ